MKRRKSFIVGAFMVLSLLINSCSGGGGGDSSDNLSTTDVGVSSVVLQSVPLGSETDTDTFISSQCQELGGIAIYTGIDTNKNGELDLEERVGDPQVVCNGGTIASFTANALSTGDTNCPLGGIELIAGDQTTYLCNQNLEPSTDYTKTSIVKGKIDLSTVTSQNAPSHAPSRASSRMEGGLWFTPASIQAAIEEDIQLLAGDDVETVPTPIVKPIKVEIASDDTYEIPDVPSGEYSLVYIDSSTNEGTKIDDIVVAPNTTVTQDITQVTATSSVSLIVSSLQLGSKIENAQVRLNELDRTTVTSADGTAEFTDLPEGTYSITISKDGYVSKYKTFRVLSGSPTNLATVDLNSQKGELSGRVVAQNVNDFANIIVYAKSADGSLYTALTNSSGNYRFPALPVGEGYSIIAFAHDFESSKIDNITINNASTTNVSEIYLEQMVVSAEVAALNPTAVIGGVISGYARYADVNTSLEYAGIVVSIEGTDLEAITSRDGSFIFNDIPAGTYTINFTDSNHITVTKSIKVISGAITYIGDVKLESVVGTLSGVVKDTDGNAVQNATILLVEKGLSAQTGLDGNFTFGNIPIGLYLFQAQKDGYSTTKFEAQINASQITDVSTQTITKQVLIGKVSKGEGATDNSGIAINVLNEGLYAVSASDGSFTINGIPAKDIVLELSGDGFKTLVISYNPATDGFTLPLQTMQSAKITDSSLTINNSAIVTNNRVLNLNIQATSAYQMLVSETLNFVNASLVDYVSSYDFNITSSGDGYKNVYVKLYDASGSEATSKIINASIKLDTTAPRLDDIILQSGTAYTNTQDILIRVTAIDSEKISIIKILDTDTDKYKIFNYNENGITWKLPTDASQEIKVILTDVAGNNGVESTRNIIFDTTAPVIDSVSVVGKSVTNSIATLLLTTSTIDYSRVEVSLHSNFSYSQSFTAQEDIKFLLSGDDGLKTLYIRTVDEAGNVSQTKTVNVTYDTTIPTKPELAITNGFTNILNYNVEISKKSTDANFEGYDVSLNGDEWVRIENSSDINSILISLAASQLNTIKVRGVDKAGNTSLTTTAYITHDENALVTKTSPSAGFYNEPITVTLSALNNTDIFYTTDGSEPTTASTLYNSNLPIVFDKDGEHTLKYFTKDTDGNEELVKTSIYKIDTVKPVVVFDTHETAYAYYPDLNVTVTDDSSVALRYELANNGASAPTPTSSSSVSYTTIPVTLDGAVVKVMVIGVDEAGNESEPVETTLRVDTVKPTLISDDNGGTYPAQTGKLVTLTALDLQDQDPKIYYTLDGTQPTKDSLAYTDDVNLSSVGTYNLKAVAIDNLGNISDTLERTYRLSTIYDTSNNHITTDTTWTKAESPYSVESTVYLESGATLTIEAGVEIVMGSSDHLEIKDGTFIAIGTESDPIVFLSNDAYYSGGVYFYDDTVDATFNNDGSYENGSVIKYAEFKNLYYDALYTNSASPYFENIKINSVNYGLDFYNSKVIAKHIDINNTKSDAVYADGRSTDISLEDLNIKNYASNAIESADTGCIVNITKSDIEYVEDKKMFYTRYDGAINSTENNYHTYNLDVLDTLVSGTSITYAPMLSTLISSADFDADGVLDVDDTDDDNDGYTDLDEAAAHTSQFLASGVGIPADFDDDNISDVTDLDDDNDGFSDVDELAVGANPKDASSTFEIVDAQELSVDTTLPSTDDVDTLLLKGNVIIPIGKTLTIKAGTKIIMGGNYSFQVHGAIKLEGTSTDKITLTPKLPSSEWVNNHFDGFVFFDDSTALVTDANGEYVSGSLLKYTDISYGGSVVATLYKTEESKTDGFAYLENVTIDHSKRSAIYVKNLSQCYMKNITLTNNSQSRYDRTIYAKNVDIVMKSSSISNSYAEAIYLDSSSLNISDSNFTDNIKSNVIYATASKIVSNRNTFFNNRTVYIYNNSELTSQDDTLDKIDVSNQAALYIASNSLATIERMSINDSSAYGVYTSTSQLVTFKDSNITNSSNYGYYAYSGSTMITGSTFTNNKDGIKMSSPFFAKIENNSLKSNVEYGLEISGLATNGVVFVSQNKITENGSYGLWTNVKADITFNTITQNAKGGIYLSGDKATPTLHYNNIYANSTTDDGDNENFDIKNNTSVDFIASNNYFGTVDTAYMAYHTFDKLDQSDRGRIFFDNYLNTDVDIVNKTSADFDGDGIVDIYDNDDDDDNITDRVETDTNNGQLDPFADNSGDDVTDIDTDRDGTLDADDTDDDGDGISDDDEATAGTDPKLADTDGDGVSDGDEKTLGSDPLVKDILSGTLTQDYDVKSNLTVYNLEILADVKLYSSNGSKLTLANTIVLYGSTIENLEVDANSNRAFEVKGDSSFTNVTISDASQAIYLNTSYKTVILDNVSIKDGESGVYFDSSADYTKLKVSRTYFSNLSSYGIYGNSINSGTIEVTQSDFNSVKYGIYYYGYYYSDSTAKINNNIFRNNTRAIYTLNNMTIDSDIKNNTFDSNEYALDSIDINVEVKDNLYTNNQKAYYSTPTIVSGDIISDDRSLLNAAIFGELTEDSSISDGKTTITDSQLVLDVDDLNGSYIQADITKSDKYLVVSNTADSITFVGDVNLTTGTLYTLLDFRADDTTTTAGAFATDKDPRFEYESYVDSQTLSGTVEKNELWRGDVNISASLTLNAKVRVARATNINIDTNATAPYTITLNKMYGLEETADSIDRVSFSAVADSDGVKKWGGLILSNSLRFDGVNISDASQAIYLNTSYKTVILDNVSIKDGESGVYFDRSAYYSKLKVSRTYFSNLSSYGIYGNSINSGTIEVTQSDFNSVEYGIIYYGYYSTAKINNNIFRNNTNAINSLDYLTTDSYIKNNTFDSNEYALYTIDANVEVKDNLYTNNQEVYAYSNTQSLAINDYIANDNPFVDKYMEDFHIIDGHEANSYASDGGEVGVYGGSGAYFAWLGVGITGDVTASDDRIISGELRTNQYWDSNTTLEGNLIVPRGKILKLAAGAEVHVPDGNTITINGEIYSEGTSGDEIVFAPDGDGSDTSSGQWGGIVMTSVGASLENAIIKYATNALTLTDSIGVNVSYVTVVNPSERAIITGTKTIVEDSTLSGATDGIYSSKNDVIIRRNVIANMSSNAINAQDGRLNIHHNIIVDSENGIYMGTFIRDNYPYVNYNTIVNSTDKGIYNLQGGDVRFNVFADNNTTLQGYASSSYSIDLSVNAINNSETADYDTIAVNPKAKYADNSDAPDFVSVASISADDLVNGGYAGIQNIKALADYTTQVDSYVNYSDIGSQLGAYNVIRTLESNSTKYASQKRVYTDTFMKNGDSMSVDILASIDDGVCEVDISAIDSTQDTISCEKSISNPYIHSFSFTIGDTNDKADGVYAISTKISNADVSETLSSTDTALITLDNTGASLTLDDFDNDSNITENTLVHLNIDDGSGIGAVKYEYSYDGGSNWTSGDSHLVLKSGGGDTWSIGSIEIDGEIVVEQKLGFNLIELNSTNFSKIGEQYFAADSAGLTDFKDYLYGLADGSLIAFVVKNDGYYGSGSFTDMMNELRKFGFEGDFNDYDSVAFIGYKGVKSSESITRIIANKNDENDKVSEIDLAQDFGIFNSAVTLDMSCYNDDGNGNCNVKVRATDYLGNVGDVFDINYGVE